MIKPKTPHEKGETLHKNGVFSNAQVKPILSLFLPLENKAFFLKNNAKIVFSLKIRLLPLLFFLHFPPIILILSVNRNDI